MDEGYCEDCYLDRESLSASCSKVQTVFEALLIPYLPYLSEIGVVDTFYCGAVSRFGAPETKVEYNTST